MALSSYSIPVSAAGVLGLGGLLFLVKRYFGGNVCHSKAVLTGKTAIVTGANTGIGLETAVDLAKRGARVILACRSVERGERAAVEVRKRSGNANVVFVQLDLASFKSIRAFAEKVVQEESHINILVNNAGRIVKSFERTEDGFECTFATNHLGPFLLTNLLLERVKESPFPRIVNVSSSAYERGKIDFDALNSSAGYNSFSRYACSKLANILFTRSLAKRLEGCGVIVTAIHPGVIRTDIWRVIPSYFMYLVIVLVGYPFFKSPWQGAQTTIHCAVCEEVVENMSGKYFAECTVKKLKTPQAVDDDVAERLWEVSSQMVGLS